MIEETFAEALFGFIGAMLKLILGLAAVGFAIAFVGFMIWVMISAVTDAKHCEAIGGISSRGICFDRRAVIDHR